MLLTDIEPKLYSAIQTALFETCAYRFGPDVWDEIEEEFRQNLLKAVEPMPPNKSLQPTVKKHGG